MPLLTSSSKHHKLNLVFISDIKPSPYSTGGPVVLWRQFTQCKYLNIEFISAKAFRKSSLESLKKKLAFLHLIRIYTEFEPVFALFNFKYEKNIPSKILEADAIITLAHGTGWIYALLVSRLSKKQLITIIHDWYPYSTGRLRLGPRTWDILYYLLLVSSKLVFGVSPLMIKMIPKKSKSVLMYPMPPQCTGKNKINLQRSRKPIRIYYSGFCGGIYHNQLITMCDKLASDKRFTLALSGEGSTDLPIPLRSENIQRLGVLTDSELDKQFMESDVCLAVLSFDARFKSHLSTHFPSKIVDYNNRALPIFIWGPKYSSSAQWAKDYEHVMTYTDPSASSILDQLYSWYQSIPGQPLIDSMMSPRYIQRVFEESITNSVLNSNQYRPFC